MSAPPSRAPGAIFTAVPLLVVWGLVLIAVKYKVTPVVSPDTFFHLRLGREMLEGTDATVPGAISRFATADWTSTQWLGQLALAESERLAGLAGVSALTGIAVALTMVAFFVSARLQGSLLAATPLLLIAFLACFPFLSGRPQVVSYALTAIVTAGWLHAARTGRLPWWTIPLVWFWSMTHGMWSVGLLIGTVALLGMSLDRLHTVRSALRHLVLLVLSALVVLLTPAGLDLYRAAVRVGSISEYFNEWGPTSFTELPHLLALALAALLVCLLLRAGPQSWTTILLTALALAWLVYATRTVPVAVAMLMPLTARALAASTPHRPMSRWEPLGITAIAVTAVAATIPLSHSADADPFGASRAHSSVASLPPGTGLLTNWNQGGYDLWRHPGLDVVSHGYGDMFTEAELIRNRTLERLDPGWYAALDTLEINEALLLVEGRLAQALITEYDWVIVAEDPEVHDDTSDPSAQEPARLVHLRRPSTSP